VGAEGREVGGADRLRQQRVVADLQVAVERQVVRGEREVGVEEQLQAPLRSLVQGPWGTRPEQAVVDEHEVDAFLARAREELGVGAHAGRHRLDLVAAGYLEPVGPVVVVGRGVKDRVQIADDVSTGCHPNRKFRVCPAF
jgi:hypothetical protein